MMVYAVVVSNGKSSACWRLYAQRADALTEQERLTRLFAAHPITFGTHPAAYVEPWRVHGPDPHFPTETL